LGCLVPLVAHGVTLVQEFYLPLPEPQLRQALTVVETGTISTTIESIFSVVVTGNGTVVHYDQWEDGYETDLANPTHASTRIWGDGNNVNGIAPGFVDDPIGLPAGAVLTLRNPVPLPRDPAVLLYDGRDRLAANKALVVSRTGWPTSPGPVYAGAVGVAGTIDYGLQYVSPVGQNLTNRLFQYVGMFVMAGEDGTSVTIDPDGSGPAAPYAANLNRGESHLVNGSVQVGGSVTATKPVQAHLIIGHINGHYACDWFTLSPVDRWSSVYYTPVATPASGNPTYVYLYNPNATNLTVTHATQIGLGNVTVPAGGVRQYLMPQGSGAAFASAGDAPFFALCTVGANNASDAAYNWGFTLLPVDGLTSEAVVGWGPGSSDGTRNGSPVWVTPTEATRIYVDYDGDHLGALTDPNGEPYDVAYDVEALQSLRVYDPDRDQTATRLYSVDGVLITAVWGEDPDVAAAGNPFIDAGTTVLPFPTPVLDKSAALVTDLPPTGLSTNDVLEYTIRLDNRSLLPLGNSVVIDSQSSSLAYMPGTTTLNGQAISDSPSGTSFPLDGPDGYTIPIILRGGSSVFTYRSRVVNYGVISNVVQIEGTKVTASSALYAQPPAGATQCTLAFTDSGGTPTTSYAAESSVFVTLTDPDANTSATTAETATLAVQNVSGGDVEFLTLTETGVNTSVFRNLTGLATSASAGLAPQDGVLNVAPGDSLMVSYTDPLYNDTATATAFIQTPALFKPLYLSANGQGAGVQALNRVDPVAYGLAPTRSSIDLGGVTDAIGLDRVSVGSNTAATITVPHATSAGANRLLLVGISVNRATGTTFEQITNVTYSGTRLTLIGARTNAPNGEALVHLWGLTNPPAGTNNVVVSFNTAPTDGAVVGVATFTNVNQTTPYGSFFSNVGTNTTPSIVVSSAPGELVFDTVMLRTSNFGATGSPGTGQTQLWKLYYNARVGAGSSTKPGAASVTNTWTAAASVAWTIGAVSIKPSSSTGATATGFVQTPAFCQGFLMPANNTVTITNFVTVVQGAMPAGPAVTAILRYGGTDFLTMSSPSYASGALVWSGILTTNVSVPSGQAISQFISNRQAGVVFRVDYDSTTRPSQILLPASTVISIDSLGVYDAPYPGGSFVTAPAIGSRLYLRAVVSDPFGSSDVTGLDLAITAPNPSANVSVSLTDSSVVANDGCSKTYEYAWQTPSLSGSYGLAATAHEGTEGITDIATTSLTLTIQDLGTPSASGFTTGNDGPAATTFALNDNLWLRVQDLNRNTNDATAEIITATIASSAGDSESVTLTETSVSSGVFTGFVPSSAAGGTGILQAPAGAILTATYADPGDATDQSSASATVLAPPGTSSVSVQTTLASPVDGQATVGESVVFEVRVVNSGTTTLNTVAVTDSFPAANLTYVSASLPPSSTGAGTLIWDNVGPLTSGQSATFTLTFTTAAVGSPVVNGTTADADGGITASSSASLSITRPALSLIASVLDPVSGNAPIGSNVTLRIVATNTGSTTITTLPLEDAFSATQFEFVSATVAPDGVGAGALLWNDLTGAGSLAVGDSITVEVVLRVVGAGSPSLNTFRADYAVDANGDSVPPTSSAVGVTTGAGQITGHVYDDPDQTGTWTAGDTGLAGVTVQIFTDPNGDGDPADGELVRNTFTAADGSYELLNLATNAYVVTKTDLLGYAPTVPLNNRLAINLSSLTTNANNDFFAYQPAPASYASLAGTVWDDANTNGVADAAESGLAGVTIDLVQDPNANGLADPSESVYASTTTDVDGNYEFLTLPPGRYVIQETDLFGYASTGDAAPPNDNQIGVTAGSGAILTGNDLLDYFTGDYPGNDAPVAQDQSASVLEDTPTALTVHGTDIDSPALTYAILSGPAHGAITGLNPNTGGLTYTPSAEYSGADQFLFTVSDGSLLATGTVALTVTAVNDAPTLDPLNDRTIDINAAEQTVSLSGIGVGSTDEAGQTLTLSATSSDLALIPNPGLTYTSPNANGTLTFTPATNAVGICTITVVVSDNGGTSNGGVDAVTNTFTVTVLSVTNIWQPDGSFPVDVRDASGPAGTGYTQTNYLGVLDIQATTNHPFTIHLVSFDGGSPGPAANFDYHNPSLWTIATAAVTVTGFDPAKFRVDDTPFTNDLGGGTFTIALSGDGKSVNVVFVPNRAPVAGLAEYGRAWGTSLRIPILNLLTNFTSDADGDGRGLIIVGLSTNGSRISTNTTTVSFAPTNNFSESFLYVIRDLRSYRPGDTVQTATNQVTVTVTNAVGTVQAIATTGGSVTVRFAGVPGYAYDVERTTDLANGPWMLLSTTNAPPNGLWWFVDPSPPVPAAYYRSKQH
jgi:uncharacterized repeat protein (TIGR01451 family)